MNSDSMMMIKLLVYCHSHILDKLRFCHNEYQGPGVGKTAGVSWSPVGPECGLGETVEDKVLISI